MESKVRRDDYLIIAICAFCFCGGMLCSMLLERIFG